jgi:hypothetical protein
MPDSGTLQKLDFPHRLDCLLDHYEVSYLELVAQGEGFDDATQMLERKFDQALAPYMYKAKSDLRETRALIIRKQLKHSPKIADCLKVDAIDWILEAASE